MMYLVGIPFEIPTPPAEDLQHVHRKECMIFYWTDIKSYAYAESTTEGFVTLQCISPMYET